MFIQFAAGYERGTCDEDYCGREYDTRLDRHAGLGMCGRCYRLRHFSTPVPRVAPCRIQELVHVAKKQAAQMIGAPAWR